MPDVRALALDLFAVAIMRPKHQFREIDRQRHMIRAFFAAIAMEAVALFLCAAVVAGITEKLSARQAGNGLLIYGAIDLLMIALSVWVYRTLAQAWGGASAPTWSLIALGLAATLTGLVMFFITMVLLNR